jgi:two-component system, OmpR family, sensor histidine kinase SenX3
VDQALVATIAGTAGLLAGAGATALLNAARSSPAAHAASAVVNVANEVVPPGVIAALSALRSGGVVLARHDKVLLGIGPAKSIGLVEGDRLASAHLLDLVRAVRRDGTIRTARLEVVDEREDIRLLAVRVARLDDDLILLLVEDRTSEHRVETMRRDFVANVSHELKTPVGAITVLAEAVADARDDPAAVERFSQRMVIETNRLSHLVQQIIDLSRVQDDDVVDEAQPIDVDQLVADALDRIGVDASAKHISLVKAGTSELVTVGHRAQLLIALGNLVENAVSYSSPYTRVVVDVQVSRSSPDAETPDQLEISVADQGLGIPESEQQRIFERFYRVDRARSRSTGGTGLGLSIVKHIMAGHQGSVRVWSAPGRGSTFTLTLPLATANSTQAISSPAAPTTAPAAR